MPIHSAGRQVEGGGNLRDGHADEVAHLNHFRSLGIFEGQSRQGVIDSQQFLGRDGHGDAGFVQLIADQVGAVFEPLFSPGDIDENLLHCAGGGLEEMPAIGELLTAVSRDLQPGLMHESRGLQSLSGFFIGHPDNGEFAQFLIDQREQLVGSLGVALLNTIKDAGDVRHIGNLSLPVPKDQT